MCGRAAEESSCRFARFLFSLPLDLQAAAVAIVDLHQQDNDALNKVVETANAKFANNGELRRKWGGGVMGLKTIRKLEKRKRLIDAEAAKKAML